MGNSFPWIFNGGAGPKREPRRLGSGTFLPLLVLSALLMAACVLGLWRLRQGDLDGARAGLDRLSLTLAKHTELAFRGIDLILRETRPALTPEALNRPGEGLHRLLREQYLGLPQGQALLAFGPDGWMRGHSRLYPTPRINVVDRDYFIAQKRGGEGLFISRPQRNRVNGRWMISLSRRLSGPDGRFAGVLMAAVEVEYFSGLYRALNLPPGSRLYLERTDGALLCDYPYDESLYGQRRAPDEDGQDVLSVTREVSGLPLRIRLSLPRAEALGSWRLHLAAALVGMLAVLAFVVALTATRRAYVRELKRRTELLERSEQALRESEARYRHIVETANEGICALDAEQRITFANEVLGDMLGYDAAQAVGRNVAEFMFPEDLAEHERQMDRRRQRERGHYERRLRHRDGHEVWCIISSAPLLGADGSFQGSLAMLTDITGRMEQERFREGIEGILRHDLRSPLASMAYIPRILLEEGNLTAQQRMLTEEMDRYVRRMLRMVDAYLALSRIEQGRFELKSEPVNLAGLLRETAQELAGLLDGLEAGLEMTLDGELLPDEVVVLGEEALCQTMLANLLKNALEASPQRATVRVELRDFGTELEIAMHNQGAVPEAIRGRFFQKYVTTGKSRGTGLGAYSARLVAEVHGGSIELDSSEPGATTVRVRLPKRAAISRPRA